VDDEKEIEVEVDLNNITTRNTKKNTKFNIALDEGKGNEDDDDEDGLNFTFANRTTQRADVQVA
jgi:hypothetical protein